ncbi:MAG: ABC transporter permease [Candidatus Eisenbacteria bacterium]|nr:ABC transporter permease [Candidatus Eisenbacteria bacterium]
MIRRLTHMVVTLLVLASILFLMFRFLPGDPTAVYIDAGFSPEARRSLMEQFGLDKPLYVQYFLYMKSLLLLDLGRSFHYSLPVMGVLSDKLVNTALLMAAAMAIAFFLGVGGGAVLAWYRGTRSEIFSLTVVLILRSMPVFWTGIMALMVFSFHLDWFPSGGMRGIGRDVGTGLQKFISFDFLHHLALPALVSAAYYIASPLLVMRSSMLEVMGEDFIEMARTKGLPERVVILNHGVRNALLPTITQLAIMAGFAIGGQILVETVFRWPGMGLEMVLAIQRSDYPIAQASFLLMGVLVTVFNFLADLSYGYLDPRVVYV